MSCSKELDDNGDGGDVDTEEQLPANKAETEQKIKGKWNVSASGEVRSIEFLNDDNYVLEVNASSPLVAGNFSTSSRLVASLDKRGSLKAETSASGTNRIFGKFTISADGKKIVLDELATIEIEGISAQSFKFTITFIEGNRKQSVTAAVVNPVDSSARTNLLARTWGFTSWDDFGEEGYDQQEIAFLTANGFKPQDEGFTFTSTGTLIIRGIDLSTSAIVEGDSTQTVDMSASRSRTYGTWRWKDGQQRAIIVTGDEGDGSAEMVIDSLSSSILSIRIPSEQVSWTLKGL